MSNKTEPARKERQQKTIWIAEWLIQSTSSQDPCPKMQKNEESGIWTHAYE